MPNWLFPFIAGIAVGVFLAILLYSFFPDVD